MDRRLDDRIEPFAVANRSAAVCAAGRVCGLRRLTVGGE
jgi:hypothetical protein